MTGPDGLLSQGVNTQLNPTLRILVGKATKLCTQHGKKARRTRLPLRESHAFLVLRVLDFLEHLSQVFHAFRDFNQVCEPNAGTAKRGTNSQLTTLNNVSF